MPQTYRLPAFVIQTGGHFLPAEECTLDQLREAEAIAEHGHDFDADYVRGIGRWIEVRGGRSTIRVVEDS